MPDKKKLSNMLDNLIDSNPEQAQVDFHDYLQDKIADITGYTPPAHVDTQVTNDEE